MSENPSLAASLEAIHQHYAADFEPLEVDGQTLRVLAIHNMRERLDRLIYGQRIENPLKDLPLWAKVWPGSFILGRFLRKFDTADKIMLELGAGMGICSLIAARYGFKQIFATDNNSDALAFARANILGNSLEHIIQARYLDVARPGQDFSPSPDFIVASELLYLDELHRPLLKFIARRLAPGGRAIFCTDMARAKPRFQKLAARQFSIAEGRIGLKTQDNEGAPERRIYNILILERS